MGLAEKLGVGWQRPLVAAACELFLFTVAVTLVVVIIISLGVNNVRIYASLGAQAYLSMQPHICQQNPV